MPFQYFYCLNIVVLDFLSYVCLTANILHIVAIANFVVVVTIFKNLDSHS